jgi:hypothetical protein
LLASNTNCQGSSIYGDAFYFNVAHGFIAPIREGFNDRIESVKCWWYSEFGGPFRIVRPQMIRDREIGASPRVGVVRAG